MRLPKALTASLGVAALLTAAAPAAQADPRNGEALQLECDTLGSVEVVVFSNGPSSPGLVVGSTQVGIPYKLEIQGTFNPAGGGEPQTFEESLDKPAPRDGRLDHCTFHQETSDESGSVTVDGEVWISYTPSR